MSDNKSENKKRSVMTLILKVISSLLITVILLVGVAWMTQDIWLGKVTNHPSGEEIERMREDAKHISF